MNKPSIGFHAFIATGMLITAFIQPAFAKENSSHLAAKPSKEASVLQHHGKDISLKKSTRTNHAKKPQELKYSTDKDILENSGALQNN